MNIELNENLASAKGKLNYVNETLNSGFAFEGWELKEYKALRIQYIEEIKSIEERLNS